jgi:membrane-bound ClpP family serine protease
MFKLPLIIIGSVLFFIGMSIPLGFFGLFGMLLALVGTFFLSRPFALDSGFGNTPAFFLIGMIVFIPSFFLAQKTFGGLGFDDLTSGAIRLTLCMIGGVIAFLSISKS